MTSLSTLHFLTPRRRLGLLAAACALGIVGCGGGGGSGGSGGGGGGGTAPGGSSFTIGGSLSGLAAGKTLVLQLNAGSDLSVSANGSFSFPGTLTAGAPYSVTVKTMPGGQTCNISRGSGTANANVSDVAISCGSAPAGGIAALVGDWMMVQCTAVNSSSSARTLIRVTQTSSSSFDWGNGLVQYPSSNCSGAGTVLPVVRIGSVQLTDQKSSIGIAAHWARATLVSGSTSHGVWAKRSDSELCLVGDESPSLFATADAVLRAIEVAPAGMCYTPLRQN